LYLGTEYFRPLGETKFFVSGQGSIGETKRSLFLAGKKQSEYRQNTALIGVDIGYSINSRSELRTGFNVGHQSAKLLVGEALFGEPSGTLSAYSIRYNYYGQNSPQFPTRGLVIRSNFNYFFKSPDSNDAYPQGEATASYSHIFNDKNVTVVRGGGGTTFGDHAGRYSNSLLAVSSSSAASAAMNCAAMTTSLERSAICGGSIAFRHSWAAASLPVVGSIWVALSIAGEMRR
jgi:outer membrane protein assembly factor BamA